MWRDVNVGPLSVSGDLNAIRDGRGSGMSPARSAVLRNMLVSQVSEIVSVVHVVPNPLIRQLDRLQSLSNIVLNRSLTLDSAGSRFTVLHGKGGCTKQKCNNQDRCSSHIYKYY